MWFSLWTALLAGCLCVGANASGSDRDLSGKKFTFTKQTDTDHVRLTTQTKELSALTVCLRFITDLKKDYVLFSLATAGIFNAFMIYVDVENGEIDVYVQNQRVDFAGFEIKLNYYTRLCATWDASTGVAQVYVNGQPSSRKHVGFGIPIKGHFSIVLGQDQDAYGGGFDAKQSFVGMVTDVHAYGRVLDECELLYFPYSNDGDVIDWTDLFYEITGKVLKEPVYACD